MANSERKVKEKQIDTLITTIDKHFDPDITPSVVNRCGGNIHTMSNWAFEEMLDDLISKANDVD